MANICVVCDKRPQVVNSVSKANNKTKGWVYPNVKVMRFSYHGCREVIRGSVCMKCVKAKKIKKVVKVAFIKKDEQWQI
jgi:large subunit ribosomal protein L28